jgi:hypothetical protein
MSAITNSLFEILESEAEDKYFLMKDNAWAEIPAIIIGSGPFAKLGIDSYTVYFGRGLADWTFKTQKAAKAKAIAVLSHAKIVKPFKVKHVNHRGKEDIFVIQDKNTKEEKP